MTEVTIRQAVSADLPEILRAYAAAEIHGGLSFTVEEAAAHLATFERYPSYPIFVALVDNQIAGTYALVILDNMAKRGARCGVVEDVAVMPDRRRQGIGRAMMAHAREQCRLAGCYKMTLSSGLPREGAHRFYDSLGFERHGYSFLIRP